MLRKGGMLAELVEFVKENLVELFNIRHVGFILTRLMTFASQLVVLVKKNSLASGHISFLKNESTIRQNQIIWLI